MRPLFQGGGTATGPATVLPPGFDSCHPPCAARTGALGGWPRGVAVRSTAHTGRALVLVRARTSAALASSIA